MRKDYEIVEDIVLEYKKTKDESLGMDLLDRFAPLFNKYYYVSRLKRMTKNNSASNFLAVATQGALRHPSVLPQFGDIEFRRVLYRAYLYASKEEVYSDMHEVFFRLIERYKDKGRSFAAYIFSIFPFEFGRAVRNKVKGPTVFCKAVLYNPGNYIDKPLYDKYGIGESNYGELNDDWISHEYSYHFDDLTEYERLLVVLHYDFQLSDRISAKLLGAHINSINRRRLGAVTKIKSNRPAVRDRVVNCPPSPDEDGFFEYFKRIRKNIIKYTKEERVIMVLQQENKEVTEQDLKVIAYENKVDPMVYMELVDGGANYSLSVEIAKETKYSFKAFGIPFLNWKNYSKFISLAQGTVSYHKRKRLDEEGWSVEEMTINILLNKDGVIETNSLIPYSGEDGKVRNYKTPKELCLAYGIDYHEFMKEYFLKFIYEKEKETFYTIIDRLKKDNYIKINNSEEESELIIEESAVVESDKTLTTYDDLMNSKQEVLDLPIGLEPVPSPCFSCVHVQVCKYSEDLLNTKESVLSQAPNNLKDVIRIECDLYKKEELVNEFI